MVYMVCHDVDYGHGDDGWSIFGSKPTHRWPGLVTSTVHRGWLENPRNKWGFCYGKTIELWLIFQRCDWLLEDTGGTCHETLKHHLSIRGSILLRQPKKCRRTKTPLLDWHLCRLIDWVYCHMEKLRNTVERHAAEFWNHWNHWKSGRENSLKIFPPLGTMLQDHLWAEIHVSPTGSGNPLVEPSPPIMSCSSLFSTLKRTVDGRNPAPVGRRFSYSPIIYSVS